MKSVKELVGSLKPIQINGDDSIAITGVQSDSRAVVEGNLFVAVPGTKVDGHSYINDVIAKGAKAIVCEKMPETLTEGVCYVQVDDSAHALGVIASEWYDNPSQKLTLVGVTGTNGKTTIATLLYEMAFLTGYKAGLLSTVCNYVGRRAVPTNQTTPDQITIQRLLAEMVEEGCSYAFMEVSSHAADQRRIDGLKFKGGVFTNLTRDHMDYHLTVDNYIKAKKRFFDILPEDAFALVNLDDKAGLVMLQNTKAKRLTYSQRDLADFTAKTIEKRLDGTSISINGTELEVQFVGAFNVYNLLAVYGAASMIGFTDNSDLLVKMSSLVPVSGRFQTLASPRGYFAIVDYAHTPDALVNVLDTLNDIMQHREGRVITLVGCGGNRDKGKRPIMAREAAQRSDITILTSDNPRFEEPDDILNDMQEGIAGTPLAHHALRIADRREAIRTACTFANSGDVILIAGKGHEDYQDIKGVKHHFDDREEVRKVFEVE